jgi:hypothetical protein
MLKYGNADEKSTTWAHFLMKFILFELDPVRLRKFQKDYQNWTYKYTDK